MIQVIDLIDTEQEAFECLLCYSDRIVHAGTTDVDASERQCCARCGPMPTPGFDLSPVDENSDECRAARRGDDATKHVSVKS